MWSNIRRLLPGIALILVASAVLLFSDLGQRRQAGAERLIRIAILQHASTEVLDDGVRGMVAGLAEGGLEDGKTVEIRRYNAEGDLSTANTVAREITNGGFDLVLTSSTPSMQAVANANRDGRVIHVFGLVADPFAAGIGLHRDDPLNHPRHLVGLGTFSRVKDAFEMARKFYPGLKRVGLVWNPGESNSVGFTVKARRACQELDIALLEAGIDNASGITDAANSVISLGAQALWVGGDNTVTMGLDVLLAAARKGRVPVFSILPGRPDRGTLFDMGNDMFEVGKLTGKLAADVLLGADSSKIPIRDVSEVAPRLLIVNKLALNGLKHPWRIPKEVLEQADLVVDATGTHRKAISRPAAGPR